MKKRTKIIVAVIACLLLFFVGIAVYYYVHIYEPMSKKATEVIITPVPTSIPINTPMPQATATPVPIPEPLIAHTPIPTPSFY